MLLSHFAGEYTGSEVDSQHVPVRRACPSVPGPAQLPCLLPAMLTSAGHLTPCSSNCRVFQETHYAVFTTLGGNGRLTSVSVEFVYAKN